MPRITHRLRGFLKRRSALSKKLLLLVASLMLAGVAAEIALRVLGLGVPLGLLYEFDDVRGMRLAANFSGWQTREGRVYVTTNAFGQRDHPRPQKKPPDTYRIAVLGDSYAEALQVEIDQTFWSVAEQRLNDCDAVKGKRIECVNFGVSGYGTAQQWLTLQNEVWQFEPDMILLAFLPYNDIRNNSPELEPETYRPFYTLRENQLVLDRSAMQSSEGPQRFHNSRWVRAKHFLISHVRLCGLIFQLREARRQAAAAEAATAADAPSPDLEVGLDAAVYLPPTGPWERAWEVTERLIVQMQQETQARSAAFAVVAVTSAAQVDPDPQRGIALAEELGVEDLEYPERRLAALARREGFHLTLLTQRMQADAVEQQRYLHGFDNTKLGTGHWNVAGHRLAGKYLAEDLCAQPAEFFYPGQQQAAAPP